MLTLWPPGPLEQKVSIAQVLGVDLDVDLFGLRQHGDRRGRGVDAAAGLGRRHALHAVHAALVLQPAVDPLPFDERDDFLDAAAAVSLRFRTSMLPALPLGVARVHAEQVRREQRRLVAAGAGADFEHDVLRVVGILRDEQDLDLGEQRVARRLRAPSISSCASSRMSGSLSSSCGGVDLRDDFLVAAEMLDQRLDLGQRLGVLAEPGVVALHRRVGHLRHQLLVARFFGGQFVEHESI